jgi:hypothetical protein
MLWVDTNVTEQNAATFFRADRREKFYAIPPTLTVQELVSVKHTKLYGVKAQKANHDKIKI